MKILQSNRNWTSEITKESKSLGQYQPEKVERKKKKENENTRVAGGIKQDEYRLHGADIKRQTSGA